MNDSRILRRAQIASTAFLAFTSVAGALGLLSGVNAPPLELLDGSPFDGYSVPALFLLLAVGGSAVTATWLIWRQHLLAPVACAAAGEMLLAFEIVQIIVIGSPAGTGRALQALYLLLGITIIGLSLPQLADATTSH